MLTAEHVPCPCTEKASDFMATSTWYNRLTRAPSMESSSESAPTGETLSSIGESDEVSPAGSLALIFLSSLLATLRRCLRSVNRLNCDLSTCVDCTPGIKI